jgi:hypothetical protein
MKNDKFFNEVQIKIATSENQAMSGFLKGYFFVYSLP